jgi:hypothetical protein
LSIENNALLLSCIITTKKITLQLLNINEEFALNYI